MKSALLQRALFIQKHCVKCQYSLSLTLLAQLPEKAKPTSKVVAMETTTPAGTYINHYLWFFCCFLLPRFALQKIALCKLLIAVSEKDCDKVLLFFVVAL